MKTQNLVFLLISSAISLWGQQPPETELFMVELQQLNDSTWAAHNPSLLTGADLRGYNNQPFLHNNKLFYTQQLNGDTNTDIFAIDIIHGKKERITRTELSEYSPTPTPVPEFISVVRVEEDGSQTLWKYDMLESRHQNLFPESEEKIGYHSWLNDSLVAMFILGDPPTLRVGNTRSGNITTYTSDIGRCLKTDVNGRLYYTHNYTDNHTYLKRFDRTNLKMELIVEIPIKSRDFELLEDRYIIMGNMDKLVIYDMLEKKWCTPLNLAPYGIKNISRLTYSDNRLVFVNSPS